MLTLKQVERIDRSGLYRDYEEWPSQCYEALRLEVSYPTIGDVRDVIYAGMGGSGCAGDILRDIVDERGGVSFRVVKDYHLPASAGKESLVMVVSYSGDTEEALNVFSEAVKRGCKVTSISSGGALEDLSRAERVPHTKVGRVLAPRSALPYLLYSSARILMGVGFKIVSERDLRSSAELLERVRRKVGIGSPLEANPSKKLAVAIFDRMPVIYGSSLLKSVVGRFKNSLSENAKMHAVADLVPELCHNEIEAWRKEDEELQPVFIRHRGEGEGVERRFEVLKEVTKECGYDAQEVWASGVKPLERIMSALYQLEFATLYAAVLRGIDPVVTPRIDWLKHWLKRRRQKVHQNPSKEQNRRSKA